VSAFFGHFGRALQAAAASRFPQRDWKRAVPASGAEADAAIDAACAKMGKSCSELVCGVRFDRSRAADTTEK
jgi:hypothetical protein